MLDKIYKALMILGLVIGIGMFAQRASSGAALEDRLASVERQTAANTQLSNETATLLKETAALLRAHEVEDAAVTAQVQVNTKLLERLTGQVH